MNARTCAAVLLALGLASRASGQCYLTQIERIKPSPTAPGDFFGYCKLYDDVAIFTNLEGISINRNAYVMHHDGTQWVQDQILTAWGNWQGGFGYSAAMDGNFVAVGAPYDSSVISNNGAVYMFEYDGTQWVQDVKLVASNASFLDQFGNEMDIEGNLMAVTAWEVSPTVFRHDGTTWVEEQALVPSDVDADDGEGRER